LSPPLPEYLGRKRLPVEYKEIYGDIVVYFIGKKEFILNKRTIG